MTQGSAARSDKAETYRRWYKQATWLRLRAAQLQAHPLCSMCSEVGRVTVATVVDHIKPHRGDWSLFSDPSNLQSLCDERPWLCHSSMKQAHERGGFSGAVDAKGWPMDPRHRANRA